MGLNYTAYTDAPARIRTPAPLQIYSPNADASTEDAPHHLLI